MRILTQPTWVLADAADGFLVGLARHLASQGRRCALLTHPVPAWQSASLDRDVLGQWRGARLFTFTPRTWLPVGSAWPFGSNAAWNGSERFSAPRTSAVLREAGFDHAEIWLSASTAMPHLVRQAQPALSAFWRRGTVRELPPIARRRRGELEADADVLLGSPQPAPLYSGQQTCSVPDEATVQLWKHVQRSLEALLAAKVPQ